MPATYSPLTTNQCCYCLFSPQLTAVTTNANTLSQELQQLRIHSEKEITALKQSHAEALHAAEEGAKQKLEAAKPVFLQMKETNEQLAARETELSATITQLNTELTMAHTQTKELEAQCVRLQRELAAYAEQSTTLGDMQQLLAQKGTDHTNHTNHTHYTNYTNVINDLRVITTNP